MTCPGGKWDGRAILFFGTDVSDAFHQVPLHGREQKYTACIFEGRIYIFPVIVFGSASAPTVWGRFAAWAGRSLATLLPKRHIRPNIYVDDPLFCVAGAPEMAAPWVAQALLWLLAAGFPLAWHKCDAGKSVHWIGATLAADQANVTVSLQPIKLDGLRAESRKLLQKATSGRVVSRT